MGRPKKTVASVPLNLSLDPDIAARIDKALFSELEGKVPHGAKSLMINRVLRKHFRSEDAKAVYQRDKLAAEDPTLREKVAADLEAFVAPEQQAE